VALDKLFIDVAVYNERVMNGAHIESVADLAIRSALANAGLRTSRSPSMCRYKRRRGARLGILYITRLSYLPMKLISQGALISNMRPIS
jgi:hypothetical protein